MPATEEVLDTLWDWDLPEIGEFLGVCRAIAANPIVGVSFEHGSEFHELTEIFRHLSAGDKQYVIRKLAARYEDVKTRRKSA